MSDRSLAITRYRPDVTAIEAAPTRVVIAVGEESINTVTGRCAVAAAEFLGQPVTVFPSHHGGFMGGEFGYAGQPKRSPPASATSCTRAEPSRRSEDQPTPNRPRRHPNDVLSSRPPYLGSP